MTTISTITSWYKYSQIEYFTPFLKLWLSFNAWYKNSYPNIGPDRNAVDAIKNDSRIVNKFNELISSSGDEGIDFKKALARLIEEVRNQKIQDRTGKEVGFERTDQEPTFPKLSKKRQNTLINSGNLLHIDSNVVINADLNLVYQETIEVIYLIRCELIHGNLDLDNPRATRLIKNAYIILDNIFGPQVR